MSLRRRSPPATLAAAVSHRRRISSGVPQHTLPAAREGQRFDFSTIWIAKVVASLFLHVQPRQRYIGFITEQLTSAVGYNVFKRLSGCPKTCFDFFKFSVFDVGVKHVLPTYSCLIKVLCEARMVECAKEVIDVMWVDGHCVDSWSYGMVVVCFAELGRFEEVVEMAIKGRELNCKLSGYHCREVLGLLVKGNRVKDAIGLCREHLSWCFTPHVRMFNIMLNVLCSYGDVDRALDLIRELGNFGCAPDVVSYNTVIRGLCRVSTGVDRGYELLKEMKSSMVCLPDVITYNTVIAGFCRVPTEMDRGYALLKEMKSSMVCLPDVVTYTSVIRGYCKFGTMGDATRVFEEMVCDGVRPNLVTYNVIIDGYCKGCDMELALGMYERMIAEGLVPDVVTFTSMIDGYCRSGFIDEAIGVWHNMHAKSIFPNAYTFSIMITSLCKEGRLNEAHDFLRELTTQNIVLQPFMYNPVIDGFCKAGDLDQANMIFEEIKQSGSIPDKMTFTILTMGHCMKGKTSEAIELFHQMLNIGCLPDDIMLNSLKSCLMKAGLPSEAEKIEMTAQKKA